MAAAAIVVGSLFAVQSRINGELGRELGNGMLAAAISFLSGLVVLGLLMTVRPTMRAGLATVRAGLRGGALRPWQCLGGIGGAALVASQALTVGVLGVALFTVGVVAGQTVSGLIVDKIGLGPAGRQASTVTRMAGALLTLCGVAIALSGGIRVIGGLGLVVLPLLAGVGIAVQQAINGRVGVTAGNALTASLVNFGIGSVVLVIASAVAMIAAYGLPSELPGNPVVYLGGLIGVVFISAAAYLVRPLGVLLFGLCTIAGQLIGSVLLDLVVPVQGQPLATSTVIGAALTLVAVGIASVPVRGRS
ncbi:MAG: DMT family transporter [Sciscionella sp.]